MSTTQTAPAAPIHDLVELARPFPDGFIERKDGNDYVAHHVVNQRLLSIVGPFDFELVEVLRGDVAEVAPDPAGKSRRARAGTPALHDVVVGGIWRLTCDIDGRRVRIEEVGDVGDVHNWPHDGARLKDAASDALKRCAMRLGLGLHLWAQEYYFLDHQLHAVRDDQGGGTADAEEAAAVQRALRALPAAADVTPAVAPAPPAAPAEAPTKPAVTPAEAPTKPGIAPAAAPAAERSTARSGRAERARPGGGRQRRSAAADATPPAARGRRGAAPGGAADDEETGTRRMPAPGTARWEPPGEELVRRFDLLVEAAGVSTTDAREFLRRSPYYGGVADPGKLHGPTLARLVARMGEERGDVSGLAAFRAKVDQVLGRPAEPAAPEPA